MRTAAVPEPSGIAGSGMNLEELVAKARAATPNERIDMRDDLAAHGIGAVDAVLPWVREAPELGRFAIRVIAQVAKDPGNRTPALDALRRAAEMSPHLEPEVQQLLRGFEPAGPKAGPSGSEADVEWDVYDRWNAAIFDALVHVNRPNEPLYLDTDADWFKNVAAEMLAGQASATTASDVLAQIVAPTFGGPSTGSKAFRAHASRAMASPSSGASRPPYLALLVFFVSIAEEMVTDSKFAAHNYYGRLTQKLVDAGHSGYRKGDVEGSYRSDANGLWGLLNQWLEDQDGQFGLATAYPSGSLPYVSIPIGQALLRERDRHVLHRVFASVLGRQRDLAADELAEALRPEITHPPFSPMLARVWHSPDRRPLLASIFSRELQQWDGTTLDPTSNRVRAQLVLAANLRTFPRLTAELAIHVRGATALVGTYEIAQTAAHSDQKSPRTHVSVQESLFGSALLDLTPGDALSIPHVLLNEVRLQGQHADVGRAFRACVVLALDAGEQRYVEVERIAAGERSLILVRDSLRSQVEAILNQLALPGWRLVDPAGVAGVPAGWVLASDVEVIAGTVPWTLIPDLQPLIPNVDLSIALDGGVRLPGTGQREEWLASAPPQVIVSDAAAGDITVSIEALDGDKDDDQAQLGTVSGVGTLQLQGLDAGHYRVHAGAAGRRASRRLVLRGVDQPRPVPPHAEVVGVLESGNVVSAIRRRANSETTVSMLSVVRRTGGKRIGAALEGRAAVPAGTAETEVEPERELMLFDEAALPPCAAKPGAHYWMIPEGGKVVSGACRHCGIRRYFINTYYGRRLAEREVLAKQTAALLAERLRSVRVTAVSANDSWQDLHDALSVIGAGSWATFEGLARQLVPSTHPANVARSLAALGIVDLDLGCWDAFVTAWSAAGPAVAQVGAAELGMTGRQGGLMTPAVRRIGHEVVLESAALGQELPRVRAAVTPAALAAALSDAVGEEVGVADPLALVQWLPEVESVIGGLRTVRIHADPEVFNLTTQTWGRTTIPHNGQAVRFGDRPRIYGIAVDGGSSVLRTDYRLAKHASARSAGVPLMSYSSDSGELQVPLGADLPAAYDRVAVLCSGRLPRLAAGRLVYTNISVEVAEELWRRLGST